MANQPIRRPIIERLLCRTVIDDESGCWIFYGPPSQQGNYLQITLRKKPTYAHRVSYEHFVGPIPEGLQLDHLCSVRSCVNPDHLEPVTARENNLRSNNVCGLDARKPYCPKCGRGFTPIKRGRHCAPCHSDLRRAWRAARKAAGLKPS